MGKKILIAGLGLLGGSLALNLKEQGHTLLALGRNRKRLEKAEEAGVIHKVSTEAEEIVPEADIVVIGTPVGTIPAIAESITPFLRPDSVVTDVGSTKEWVCRNMKRILDQKKSRFVGSHPMAGSEKTGFENAFPKLFEKATVVITKTGIEDDDALDTVRGMWESTGAVIRIMDPAHHDRLVASTSHLPHAVAFAMAYALDKSPDAADNFFGIYGKGLLDTLRIAASDPVVWEDIIRSNRLNIANALEDYRGHLDVLENWIRQGHYDEIVSLMKTAGDLRNRL